MPTTQFDRDSMARWYASEHLKIDPGVRRVYYLPKEAPEREIRFIEINELLGERADTSFEAVDYGVDTGSENEHKLFVLDVTPDQWDFIRQNPSNLPPGWTLEDARDCGGVE